MDTAISFPKYKKYKDSGVEWLGDIPADWTLARLGSVFEERKEKVSDKEFAPLSVTKNGVVPQLATAAKSDDGDNRKGVRLGDFVINSRSDRKGSSGIAHSDGSVSLINIVLKPKGIVPSYCEHLLKSNGFIEEFYRVGHGIVADLWTTKYWDMKSIQIPLPDLSTQQSIANFLDQKTAEIDAAIAKKQRLIELLKEQKAILINQAVTQGLDPNVPMRDSGVEWIGKVPEHWLLPPMYSRFRIELGKMLDSKKITGKHLVPYLRNTDVQWGRINNTDLPMMDIDPIEIDRYSVRNGDLLVCEGGEIGRCAIWSSANEEEVIGFQKALHRVRSFQSSEENIRYLFYVMKAAGDAGAFQLTAKTSTISHLTGEMFRAYRLPKPPIEDQDKIVDFLDTELDRVNELVQRERTSIKLLHELKGAFISEAVTGKIKL
ncbi:MAG: restriction endonuclease subunit S [Marinomonas sp.]|nr:MAG: restriction endonuclease subunit S [Marinomonas sp.]